MRGIWFTGMLLVASSAASAQVGFHVSAPSSATLTVTNEFARSYGDLQRGEGLSPAKERLVFDRTLTLQQRKTLRRLIRVDANRAAARRSAEWTRSFR